MISSANATKINLPPDQIPETTKIKLGYLPIIEAAALVIAKERELGR